jgi:hypothetical protein
VSGSMSIATAIAMAEISIAVLCKQTDCKGALLQFHARITQHNQKTRVTTMLQYTVAETQKRCPYAGRHADSLGSNQNGNWKGQSVRLM